VTDAQADELIRYARDIAGAFVSIAKTLELDYNRKYPAKKEPRDVDITYIKTEEEQLREDQGSTGEATIEEWVTIGPREQAVLAREERERANRSASHHPGKNGSQ
jgi:hypothetical protein